MPDKNTVRALMVLRAIAELLRQTAIHPRPLDLMQERYFDDEWKRLGVDREYPQPAFTPPMLYEAYDLLSQQGLVDDFSSIRAYANKHKLTVSALHVLHQLLASDDGGAIWKPKIQASFAHQPYTDADSAINRLMRANLAEIHAGFDESQYVAVNDQGRRLRDDVAALAPLLDKQTRYDLTYQVTERGLAFARTISDAWTTWELPHV